MQPINLPYTSASYGQRYAKVRMRRVDGHDFKEFFCPECDAPILNFMTPEPYYQCTHNSWGASGHKPSDRDVLDSVLAELKAIKALLRDRQ